jgi:hypothetical protein
MTTHENQLNEVLFESLQSQTFVLLTTMDAEHNHPMQHAISWIYAAAPQTLRFAVDHRSRMVTNVNHHSIVNVTIFANESVYAINGKAKVVEPLLADVPLKLTCIDVSIESVKNIMYYGSKVTHGPVCEKTYDQRAAEKLDEQVFAAMKKA